MPTSVNIHVKRSSVNFQKVIWLCTEVGIPFETIDIGGMYKGNDSESFIKMNLNEKVSVLDYNNFIIYGSNVIIKFISEYNNLLIPAYIKVNALVNQWINWASFTFGILCQLLTAHMAHLSLEEREPKKIIEAQNIINKMLKVLDVQLCKSSYLVRDKFRLADISAGCWFSRCKNFEIDMSSFEGVTSWAKTL